MSTRKGSAVLLAVLTEAALGRAALLVRVRWGTALGVVNGKSRRADGQTWLTRDGEGLVVKTPPLLAQVRADGVPLVHIEQSGGAGVCWTPSLVASVG